MKMAAVGSAKSDSGAGQRGKNRPGAVLPRILSPTRALTLEEARCPVCSEILLEPVTMPCRHSVCLHCFKRTVELSSLCCPLCRLRVSSWARKQSREKSLVNTELWEMVRQSYPERCKRRMEQRDGEAIGEEIFRSPAHIFKPGEMRQDYENQKLKGTVNEEKEEKKRKVTHHRKEECGPLKHFQDPFCGVLSDSENEEPIGKRTRHVSAFVRKTRCSPAFTKGCLQNNVVQRSRSCTDSDEGCGKVRGHSYLATPEKANITHSYNAGILLSSENSRSLSAPIFAPDKRHHWRTILASSTPFIVPHAKSERSISPESNDSISEELNHFKPIVCSPCTPPKRLPDGRLVEPTIVKSTPRNLTRSLQKCTSYEASPTILQKWKQIEVDRQSIKVTSKGTITSPMVEDLTLKESPVEERMSQTCSCTSEEQRTQERQCNCGAKTDVSATQGGKHAAHDKQRLIPDQPGKEGGLSSAQSLSTPVASETLTNARTPVPESVGGSETRNEPTDVNQEQKSHLCEKNAGTSDCTLSTIDPQDQNKSDSTARKYDENRPTSRRGKKKCQKTKHLEEAGPIKRSRTEEQGSCSASSAESDFHAQRTHQEREDRELALRLQRQFDRECRKVDRQKASPDRYPLRSWTSTEGRTRNNPRRSRRLSKKKEHLNYSR
ncbi:E3 ubiquitin-protein ligase RNF169 [Chanos chanos]|uniref:RING-type E3 ubiquitin transferase n=1 Tax=Chanos chanos TaxID=29144 RepID=A0A6J2VP56_CHACN|nr:E3 ubiquitin-protein ligase RNF169 [Chanos chanos]